MQVLSLLASNPLHESIAILSISRESTIFFGIYIVLVLGRPTPIWSRNISILVILVLAISIILKNFDPKNCPKNGQKLPKFVKICQNLSKFAKIWQKMTKILDFFGQNHWYWCCIGPSRKFFRYSIGLESIFGPKMTLVLVLG